jgi:hypothetical protein
MEVRRGLLEEQQWRLPSVPLLLLSAVLVAWIVLLSLSSGSISSSIPSSLPGSREKSSSSSTKQQGVVPQQQPSILQYELVQNGSLTNVYGDNCKVLRFAAHEQGNDGSYKPASVHRWATLLTKNNNYYIQDFTRVLQTANMDAYFFETKGVTASNAHEKAFEFVLVESRFLYRFADAKQDSNTFANHLQCSSPDDNDDSNNSGGGDGCVFENLNGESLLTAPKPVDHSAENIYGHLAAFCRRAPLHQVVNVWRLILETYLQRLESKTPDTVWLSTDGTGVAWLHVRMDPQPKYYDYQPFANET